MTGVQTRFSVQLALSKIWEISECCINDTSTVEKIILDKK